MKHAIQYLAVMLVIAAGCTTDNTVPAKATVFMRHNREWIAERMASMMAVDDAYIWHDVLGGRAIHQNSHTNPPTEALEGNFHTQQQSYFALLKMHRYELTGSNDEKLLDDAGTLLDWVVTNGYDPATHRFYFRYNLPKNEWSKDFYPEFNMFSVAALLRYDSHRSSPEYRRIAYEVFDTIVTLGWGSEYGGFMHGFIPDPVTGELKTEGEKTLYGAGYLALLMMDSWYSTGDPVFRDWAVKAVDFANSQLWDDEYGGWYLKVQKDLRPVEETTKFTHINADMVQANYLLYSEGSGDSYLNYAERGLAFILEHSRMENNLWAKHNTRDGSDFRLEHGITGSDTGGTHPAYDRQMQVITALALGWRVTGNEQYPALIDDTLDAMETNHKIIYPAGINYGYGSSSEGENTWCHLWGLKGFMAIMRIQGGYDGW